MNLALAGDHHAHHLLQSLSRRLSVDHQIIVCDTVGDYPDAGDRVSGAIVTGEASRGIVLCGSGVGVAIACCKVPGIRAAVVHSPEAARACVEHGDCQIIALSADTLSVEEAQLIVEQFLLAEFSGLARHQRRLDKLSAIEERYLLPHRRPTAATGIESID